MPEATENSTDDTNKFLRSTSYPGPVEPPAGPDGCGFVGDDGAAIAARRSSVASEGTPGPHFSSAPPFRARWTIFRLRWTSWFTCESSSRIRSNCASRSRSALPRARLTCFPLLLRRPMSRARSDTYRERSSASCASVT